MSSLQTIQGSLKFLILKDVPKDEKPYMSSVPFGGDGARTSNFTEEEHEVDIQDVRGFEETFKLETHGFQFINHQFGNDPDDKIEGPDHPYLAEVAEYLQALLKAKDVVIYDCNVRKLGDSRFFQAARSAHIDHSSGNALWRLQECLQMFRPSGVTFERCMAVTLWRPISHPVTDWPLAVCDYTSIELSDLHEVDTVLPHRVNEIYHLEKNPSQRWYYMSNQGPNEGLLMKIYDSNSSQSRYSAHAAFDIRHKGGPLGPPRHSADVRAFALF